MEAPLRQAEMAAAEPARIRSRERNADRRRNDRQDRRPRAAGGITVHAPVRISRLWIGLQGGFRSGSITRYRRQADR